MRPEDLAVSLFGAASAETTDTQSSEVVLWLGRQVAIVTGASRGIGRAIACRLATHGAAICVNYATRKDEAEAVVAEIAGAGGRADRSAGRRC